MREGGREADGSAVAAAGRLTIKMLAPPSRLQTTKVRQIGATWLATAAIDRRFIALGELGISAFTATTENKTVFFFCCFHRHCIHL